MNNFFSLSPSMIDYHHHHSNLNSFNDNSSNYHSSSSTSLSHHHIHHNHNQTQSPNNKNNQINQMNGVFLNGLNEFSNNRVSAFLPLEEIIANDQSGAKHEVVSRILADVYSQEGNIDNLIRVISFHPDFLKEFIGFSNYLMYGQHGALPYESRHYLAIMAAARHKCIYLVRQQERELTLLNGNRRPSAHETGKIPQKLKDLDELNKLLCHQPWMVNSSHIEKILKSQYSWTVTELLMAITILTHFHALSGFVFGCGINENYMQQLEERERKEKEEKERKEREEELRRIRMSELEAKSKLLECSNSDEDFDEDLEYDEEEGYSNRRGRHRNHNQRARSNSTSTSNRTLSNSSASSCELGIDMLLKEMQMIQAEDNKAANSNNKAVGSLSSSVKSSTSSLYINNTSHKASSITSSSPLIMMMQQQNSYSATGIQQQQLQTMSSPNSYLSDLSNQNPKPSSSSLNGNNRFLSYYHDNNNNQISTSSSNNLNLNNNNNDENYEDNLLYSNSNNLMEDLDSDLDLVESNSNELQTAQHNNNNNNNLNAKKSNYTKNKSKNLKIKKQNAPVNNIKSAESVIVAERVKEDIVKYLSDPDYTYCDFEQADQSLRLEYYTWENQGYCTALSLYPDICEYLDKNFKIAVNMTYNTMGNLKDVDTSLFRRAVWHYIHSLFGVRYDDYDYNQIRILLKSPLRKYIKILCSCPERITKSHYDSIMKEFTHSEKVHVNIVIMEARIQASMLYFLRAINSYFG